MKKKFIFIGFWLMSFILFVYPVQAIDYFLKKSSPSPYIISNTLISSVQYTEFSNTKSQILQISPYLTYNNKWKENLSIFNTNLQKTEAILLKLKSTTDANIKDNPKYYDYLASTLLALEKYFYWVKNGILDTGFKDSDKNANQMFNLLSTVMKTMTETRSGIVRNMN